MQKDTPPKKHVKQRGQSVRIAITLSQDLIDLADKAAEKDFTTRSDIIRTALLWYLRPQGRELDQTDPETILRVLNQRRLKSAVRKSLKDS